MPTFPIDVVAPDGTPWQVSTAGELEEVRARGYKLLYAVDGVDMPVADRAPAAAAGASSAAGSDAVPEAGRPGLVRSTFGDGPPVETRDGVAVDADPADSDEKPTEKAAELAEKKPDAALSSAAPEQSTTSSPLKPSSRRRAAKES